MYRVYTPYHINTEWKINLDKKILSETYKNFRYFTINKGSFNSLQTRRMKEQGVEFDDELFNIYILFKLNNNCY